MIQREADSSTWLYQILEDTLVGYQLPAYQKTASREPVATAKF